MTEASASIREGLKREAQTYSSAALKIFLKEVTLATKPFILDLGCISDSNIEFFTHNGCKVFVKDILNANVQVYASPGGTEEISIDQAEIDFEYPEKFFDGILLWDLFDHFDSKEAQLLLNKCGRILKDKGLGLALFRPPSPTPFNIVTRYRIISPDEISYETLPLTTQRHKVYNNSDIADLFSSFPSYTSYLPKHRWREVILRR